jgi:cysteine-rich repeat protein
MHVRATGLMACVVMLGVTAGVRSAGAAPTAAARAAFKCRTLIGQRGSALVSQALAKLDGCHLRRDKGSFSGDCNRLDLSAARQKLANALRRVCSKAPDVLANYASGDAAGAIAGAAAGNLEDSGRALQGSPALGNDKKKIRCHGAIGKARSNIVNEVVRRSTLCQRGVDKRAATFKALAPSCVVSPRSAGRALGAITRACGGMVGADVGSCPSLPGCVAESATTTGRRIASAFYSRAELAPECHNGVVDPGEVCDTPVDTPECVNCKGGNSCGDGLPSGNEQCDDGNAASGDGCSPTCQVELPPSGFLVTVVVSVDFDPQVASDVAGVEIQLGYVPSKVGIPGTGNVPAAEGRVTKLGTAPNLEVADVNDQYLKIVYAGTDATAVQPGNLARILMDGLPGAVVGAGDFACAVTLFTDSQGVTFPGSDYGITCAVAVTTGS